MPKAETEAPPREWVKLKAPHTHRGVQHGAGDVIKLRADQTERLVNIGTAERTSAPKGE